MRKVAIVLKDENDIFGKKDLIGARSELVSNIC